MNGLEVNEASPGIPSDQELREIGEGSPTFLEFSQRIESGEGEINSQVLEQSHEQGQISKDELGTLALALLKKIEPRADKAGIDELTGLSNLMIFNEKLTKTVEELRFAQNDKRKNPLQSIMVFALDMNSLKTLNDTYGHKVGNYGLITLANRLKKSVKDQDVVARVGGDEFLILMPIETDEEGIHEKIIERIRKMIGSLTIDMADPDPDRKGQTIPLPFQTAMGYAVLDKNNTETTAEELLKAADTAMYENKAKMKATAK